MTRVYFIRHGETEYNVLGILTGRLETKLTKKGIDDAKVLSLNLKENFDYYYCSPLSRTIATLKAIKGDVEYQIDERLIEVYSGKWQGLYKKDLPKREYDLYKKGLLDPPQGETSEQIKARIKSFLNDIFTTYRNDEKILVVTHNAFIRNLKRLFTNKDEGNEPKNLEIFVVDTNMYNKFIKDN